MASNPPTKEYLEAIIAPDGPWALLKPNSIHEDYPAINFIRVALEHNNVGKFVKFNNGVSINYKRANGPSNLKSG